MTTTEHPMAAESQRSSTHHVLNVAVGEDLVVVRDLHTSFKTERGVLRAVDGVNLTIKAGQSLGIVGESGSGKTVMARSIIGLLPRQNVVQSGSATIGGHEVIGTPHKQLRKLWGSDVAMVFQDPMTALNPTKRIGEQIAESLRVNLKVPRGQAKSRAVEMLAKVGIPSPELRAKAYPNQLSGGMRQRVMIAIALACEPAFLVADEPTTGLDVTVQAQILDLIGDLRKQNAMSMILVTHDLGVVASRTEAIAVVYAGRIVEQASTTSMFARVAMPYTEALLESTPRIDAPSGTKLASIEGRPPDLVNTPVGCAFAPRCRYATDLCRTERPPLQPSGIDPDHLFACWHPLNGHTLTIAPTQPERSDPAPTIPTEAP